MSTPLNDSIADDLLDGVAVYSNFTGWPPRKIYYLLEKGHLPGGKMGNRWIGSKRVVRKRLGRLAGESEVA